MSSKKEFVAQIITDFIGQTGTEPGVLDEIMVSIFQDTPLNISEEPRHRAEFNEISRKISEGFFGLKSQNPKPIPSPDQEDPLIDTPITFDQCVRLCYKKPYGNYHYGNGLMQTLEEKWNILCAKIGNKESEEWQEVKQEVKQEEVKNCLPASLGFDLIYQEMSGYTIGTYLSPKKPTSIVLFECDKAFHLFSDFHQNMSEQTWNLKWKQACLARYGPDNYYEKLPVDVIKDIR